MNPQVGQVWRWHHEDEDHPWCAWDELWLLLTNDYSNRDAFCALSLHNGQLGTVFPIYAVDYWEFVL